MLLGNYTVLTQYETINKVRILKYIIKPKILQILEII